MVIEGDNLWQKLRHPRARVVIAQNFAMDWSMLWKDQLAGFLIAGVHVCARRLCARPCARAARVAM